MATITKKASKTTNRSLSNEMAPFIMHFHFEHASDGIEKNLNEW